MAANSAGTSVPAYIDRFDQMPGQQQGAIPVQPGAGGAPPLGQGTFIDRFDQPANPALPPVNPREPALNEPGRMRPLPPPAWPPGSQQGDGTIVRTQPQGSVSYDKYDQAADQFGGDAGFLTTFKASMVPETSPENMQKKIRIYSRNMKIPENRFFVDDEGNIQWVDLKGQNHFVVPSVSGGSMDDPVDLLRRTGAAVGHNFGPTLPAITGGAAAMRFGPLAGAATAAATDQARQMVGNYFAGDEEPTKGTDFANSAWQAAGVGAGEVLANVGSSVVSMMTNKNPYNLADGEIKALQQILQSGTPKERAAAANALGLHLTPQDLTDLPALTRLETTVNRNAGAAGDHMKTYYDERSSWNFPNAVGNLFKAVSPEGTPAVGFRKLQEGAENTIALIRNQQTQQGIREGWGEAISSGARPDVRAVVANVQDKLKHTSGPVKEQLERLLSQLKDNGGTLVTDYERLHNLRLDVESTLDGLRQSLPPGQRGRMTEVFDPIYAQFNRSLEDAHPGYARGSAAYSQAGAAVQDIRDGLLTVLSQDPKLQEKLGGAVFSSDAEVVKRARQLFIAAGQKDNWDAGTRAFLQDTLNTSRGPNVSSTFAGKTAPYDSHRLALNEALDDGPPKALLNQTLDIGNAQGRVSRPPRKGEVESDRLQDRQAGSNPVLAAVRAALSPWRFTKELGDDVYARGYNSRAEDMAHRLTGSDLPRPTLMQDIKQWPGDLRRSVTFQGARPPPPTVGQPSTARVMQHLEDTARPFGGWQQHLLERALSGAAAGGIGGLRNQGLLGQPDPTDPTAEDLMRGGLLQYR